ncbi:hypothetical protein [Paraburkholderia aspalathi]|uniref:hypothetical protein n=1 Tax=Paraburkholderia aspalathi TaxID=1324617 RepID=UPI0038B76D5D
MPSITLACLANPLPEEASQWPCPQRRHYPAHADVWCRRFNWQTELVRIRRTLASGTFRFEPLSRVTKTSRETVVIWSAADTLVIKCLTLLLRAHIPVHPACEHARGHGEGVASVARVHQPVSSKRYPFICRTDIRQYYANINKSILPEQLREHVSDPLWPGLLAQVIHY